MNSSLFLAERHRLQMGDPWLMEHEGGHLESIKRCNNILETLASTSTRQVGNTGGCKPCLEDQDHSDAIVNTETEHGEN